MRDSEYNKMKKIEQNCESAFEDRLCSQVRKFAGDLLFNMIIITNQQSLQSLSCVPVLFLPKLF